MKYKRDRIIASTGRPPLRIPANQRGLLDFRFNCPECQRSVRENLINAFLFDYLMPGPWFWHYICRCGKGITEATADAARGHLENLKGTQPDLTRQILNYFSDKM